MNQIEIGDIVCKKYNNTEFVVKEIMIKKGGDFHDGYSFSASVLLDDLTVHPIYYENQMCQIYIEYYSIIKQIKKAQ